jgi:2-dehydro-3-deoxyglucarate aldolase
MGGFNARLRRGEVLIGSWLCLGSAGTAEVIASADFDWMVVDLEHSATTLGDAQDALRVLSAARMPALIRVSQNDPIEIRRVMDMGAEGVVVPMVTCRADAERAISAVHYPPAGTRGVGLCRANRYGVDFEDYFRNRSQAASVVVQIEDQEAIRNLEEILTTPGVCASMVGPYDLSASLGSPGDFSTDVFTSAMATYRRVSEKVGVPTGIHVVQPDPEAVDKAIAEGHRFIAMGTDFMFLRDSVDRVLSNLKNRKRVD